MSDTTHSSPKGQQEFISKVAHDLKTPLTVISVYAQLMIKKIEAGEKLDAAPAKKINEVAKQMADQISALAKNTTE